MCAPVPNWLQQLVTGLELTADRGSARGQLVSGSTTSATPPSLLQSSNTNFTQPPKPQSLRTRDPSYALGVKGVQADGHDLACRMLTIRQKTLIAFN